MNKDIKEHLSKSNSASDYINDFVHSKNKMFKGHSKKERIKQALAAYYSKREEEIMNDKVIKETMDKNNVQELSDVVLSRYSQKAGSDIESRGLKAREAFIDDKKKTNDLIKKNLKRIKGQELADSKVRKHSNMDEGKTFKDRDDYSDKKSNSVRRAIKKGYENRQLARAQKSKERDYAGMNEIETAWRRNAEGKAEEAEVHHYDIYRKSGTLSGRGVGHENTEHTKVGEAKTKKGAQRSVDKRDNDYGAYVHFHKPVFKDTMSESEEIDEISAALARSYYSKAATDRRGREDFSNYMESKGKDVSLTHERKLLRRDRGIRNVEKKLAGKAKVPATNEEKINEISKDKVDTYFYKAVKDQDKRMKDVDNAINNSSDRKTVKNLLDKHRKRSESMSLASDKRFGSSTVKVPATNEEKVNEISSKTLGSYIDKSVKDIDDKSYNHGFRSAPNDRATKEFTKGGPKREQDIAKRKHFVKKAVNKLVSRTNEDIIDEISSKTLGSYIDKSAKDIDKRSFEHGLDFVTSSNSENNLEDNRKREEGINKRRFYIKKAVNKLVSRTKD